MWEKGPWYTFGVTEDTVQIARRVLGSVHPRTVGFEGVLENVRRGLGDYKLD